MKASSDTQPPVHAPIPDKAYLRAPLYPARFLYSWSTGGVASNDAAADYATKYAADGLDAGLVERALACRNAGADPSSLFADRHKLPDMCRILSTIALDSAR